jgi:hypothetical protein
VHDAAPEPLNDPAAHAVKENENMSVVSHAPAVACVDTYWCMLRCWWRRGWRSPCQAHKLPRIAHE